MWVQNCSLIKLRAIATILLMVGLAGTKPAPSIHLGLTRAWAQSRAGPDTSVACVLSGSLTALVRFCSANIQLFSPALELSALRQSRLRLQLGFQSAQNGQQRTLQRPLPEELHHACSCLYWRLRFRNGLRQLDEQSLGQLQPRAPMEGHPAQVRRGRG